AWAENGDGGLLPQPLRKQGGEISIHHHHVLSDRCTKCNVAWPPKRVALEVDAVVSISQHARAVSGSAPPL
ncbi:MAG: hypothetical protein Q8J67_08870, partial [Rhodocyclaceae bacterium]|nr:hypothetical protein [Rhodocyclaceae bacterium]